jgi:hypothetical protein
MTFPVFMEELQAEFLEHKWQCKLRIKILCTPQGSLPFMEWIIQMQGMNAILFGRNGFVSDESLRDYIKSMMEDALKEKCELNDIDLIPQFRAWCLVVEKLNIAVRQEKMTALAAANELNWAAGKRTINGTTKAASTTTPSVAGSGSLARLPKLT